MPALTRRSAPALGTTMQGAPPSLAASGDPPLGLTMPHPRRFEPQGPGGGKQEAVYMPAEGGA
jgi:hypothetical protein